MRMFFDDRQRAHAPTQELHNGGFTTYAEMPARVDAILAALGPVETPADRGETAILAVHSPAYVAFLKDAARLWREAGRTGDAIPYAFPIRGRRPLDLTRIDALIGAHSFDATTPITPDSWAASYGSAQSALAATHAVLEGDRAAFALCRPPGHHAGADYCGGYCHLNTAAIAAQAARDAGVARVAILDIDYHHGNGTQDIFYDRGDVFYASVHADPRTDYPFFWGHADETGDGEGLGATLNLPLPHGTAIDAFRTAQTTALDAIATFNPGLLVVSFGADTWEGDPISHFALTTPDYAVLARDIAARGWPTAIVMEGGYAVDALGRNVDSFLRGF
ncbi:MULTISPECIES: histone deacetylase family protein [Sphingomonas]|jgi:acetoin utilization deacetylase AcuC-like enzyme|uniref:histone deacetylase family protein n=1 Tax=Sphingomonas TaxID=13687 RepID=UPI0004DB4ED2|nr:MULTISPECIES: histone deacetylase family protein [Sphingomonas]KQM92477.1 acetylpolyamine aminohydrolase [Sphingomonas sp. Leaf226]MDY0967933.1 histone deacetylase family protein [Sphingomonas sp. CFBP9021]USR00594.1 histone deacetylase family protein [Sphingomonas aerolata]